MAELIVAPAQLKPAAATLSTLLAVASGKSVVASTLTITNIGSATETARVAVSPAAAAIADAHYKIYNLKVSPGNPYMATVGWLLAATDIVRVYSSGGNLVFNLEQMEVT